MPITLNHSNISVQYSTGSNYIIETVKSDLYLRDSRTGISSNLTGEPVLTQNVIVSDAYYPRTPSTNSATWVDNGYTMNVKVSDAVLGTGYVYFLFNHIITSQDHYHSQQSYTGTGNTYAGATIFKTFAGIAIGVDFGRSIYPKRMRIAPRPLQAGFTGNDFINGAPKAFKIFASDDASCWNDNNHSSWTQIHDQTTGLTYTNEQYTIVNLTANLPKYRYYTMVVLSTIGNYAGGYMMIAEWNMGGDEKIDPVPEGNPITHKRLNFAYNNDNLIAWYRFNGDYLDSSGNGHNLTNVGTVIQSTQVIEDQAVEFDGTDYLEFPSTINPYTIWNNGSGITFSFWVRFTAHETWERLIDFQTGANSGTGFFIAIKGNPNGVQKAIYADIAGVTFQYSNWSDSLITTLGVWHHFVWCINKTGKWDIYLNNVRINGTETANIPNITYNFRYINKSAFSVDGTWDGQMDDFRIYNRALSATDVSLLYNKTYTMPPNTYTLNFPVPTFTDINNNSNIVLQGTYDISLSSTNASIIPKTNQYIPKPTTFSTSIISLRYHLLNPVLDSIGAQWTYNSSNANVYHMGNVGIGTTSPEYHLDVRGTIFSSTGGYTQSGLTTWSIASDRRIKENIVKASYEKCLENVKNIELYNFNFKDNYVNTNDRRQLGFIAQEVQQVYPKAVEVGKMMLNTNETIDNVLTLNTTQIKYTLYGAIKELINKVEKLETKINT